MTDQMSGQPTVFQQLAPIVRRTGYRISLKPYEHIVRVEGTDTDNPRLLVRCVQMTERSTGFQINKTGRRLISFTKRPDGTWAREDFVVWDAEPDIAFCRTLGASITPALKRERDGWAHLCYRPGTDRHPLDNSDRTHLDIEHSSSHMIKHWS